VMFFQLNNDLEFAHDSISLVLRACLVESLIRQGAKELLFWAVLALSTSTRHGYTGLNRLSTTLPNRSFRIEFIRKCQDAEVERLSPRPQNHALTRLRDDLHLAALRHAKEITSAYSPVQDFSIPAESYYRKLW
jgi:hypothetical protein